MQEGPERFERALQSRWVSHPGLDADLGEGQQVEVAHLVADPLETIIFCRVRGAADGHRQIPPQVRAIYPPELAHGGASGTTWNGYRVFALPPLLPHRRTLTVGLIPGLALGPDGRPGEEQYRRMSVWHANPPALLTIPVPERAPSDGLRRLSRPVHRFPDGSELRVLGAESSELTTVISLLPGQPGIDLHGAHLGPVWVPPPTDGPADLWQDLPMPGRPGGFRVGSDRRRVLERGPWAAWSLGAGEAPAGDRGPGQPLAHRGSSGAVGQAHPFELRFAPLPAGATGLRLRKEAVYQWGPAEARAVLPAPGPPGPHREPGSTVVDLTGRALTGPDFRLDLLAWEEGDQGYLLVGRPDRPFHPPAWPDWLPDIRLILQGGSVSLTAFPCEDGTICAYLPDHLAQGEVQLGIRAVGRRLPPLELVLHLEA